MTDIPLNESIFIIWSSENPEVAHNLVLMYAHNALLKEWWGRVRLIIWGPSAKLVSEDEDIQAKLKEMKADGVEIWACRACADNYGVTASLEALDLNVVYVGTPVTEMIKDGWKQLTF
ncbi:DsrE family protein [Pseudodesulfovibrio piezophilus]|nr:DsrE family protein [Pseudodesulfovibrio piezophilus]